MPTGRRDRQATSLPCAWVKFNRFSLTLALFRGRRRIVVCLAVLVLLGAVAAHHALPSEMHGMPAAAICLAIIGGIAVIAPALAGRGQGHTRTSEPAGQLVSLLVPEPRSVPARAGPLFLSLSVLRR
jgi:hypothetical protein